MKSTDRGFTDWCFKAPGENELTAVIGYQNINTHLNVEYYDIANTILEFSGPLQKADVPVERHVFEHGRHGRGFALNDPALRDWPVLLENWLDHRGLLSFQRAQK
jgi:hypothetical protein